MEPTEPETPDCPAEAAPAAEYEPPTLTLIGDLHNLGAKSGKPSRHPWGPSPGVPH